MTDDAKDGLDHFGPQLPAGARSLYGPDEIRRVVDRLGRDLRKEYGQQEVTVVIALKGALVFAADLIRRLDMPVELRTVTARSYHGDARRPGELDLGLADLGDLSGRHVLVVDDILDTGNTLSQLVAAMSERGPASVKSAVMLDKPSRREVPVEADFVGLTIDDLFVVGYGLDFDGLYRNLPYIAALAPEAAEDGAADGAAQPDASSASMGDGRLTNTTQPSSEAGA